MKKTLTATEHANIVKRLRAEIRTRNGSTTYLVFGTAISSALIGMKIADQFNLTWFWRGMIIGFCIVAGYFAVDAAVNNNLVGASDTRAKKEIQDYFHKKAISALICTVLFSMAASYFVGQFSKGKSPYEDFSKNIAMFSKRDSTNKALAAATLSNLSSTEKKEIANIKQGAKAAEKKISNFFEGKPTSESWRKDYQAARKNKNHWMWVCNECPKKYRRWRDAIQDTRNSAALEIRNITKTNTQAKAGLTTTLAYQMQTDTTVQMMSAHTISQAAERERNSIIFTMILVLLTLAAAFGAYSSNNNIKVIQDEYGQLVEESDQIIFDVIEDLFSKLIAQFLSLVFGVLVGIDKALEKIGVDLYEIEGKAIAKFSTNHPTNQFDQADQEENNTPRVVVSAFGQNKPDQPETLGRQDLPIDRPIADQLVNVGRPIGQVTNTPPTSPTNTPEKVIEKQTKLIINNVNVSAIKRACKRSYLRSFFPSNDSQYLKRDINKPPARETLERNRKTHLEKVEELRELGINIRYIGTGKDRGVEFI